MIKIYTGGNSKSAFRQIIHCLLISCFLLLGMLTPGKRDEATRHIDPFRTPYSRVVLHGTCLCECSCVLDGTCDPLGSVCHNNGYLRVFSPLPRLFFPIFVSTLPQNTPPFPISIPERAGYVDT